MLVAAIAQNHPNLDLETFERHQGSKAQCAQNSEMIMTLKALGLGAVPGELTNITMPSL